MNEGAVFLVVVVIAVLSYRYFAGTGDALSGARPDRSQSGTRGRQVTPAMVEVIHAMFPSLPPSSIAYDLSRTGSVEVTTDNILSQNTLPPAPPDSPFYRLFPTPAPRAPSPSSSVAVASKPDLISRYNLGSRLSEDVPPEPTLSESDKGKGKEPSKWSQSQNERENNFKKRRDDMILRARQQMLEQGKPEQSQ